MVKNREVKEVTEDGAVGGNRGTKTEKTYSHGFDDFQFPYTVSFYGKGKYEVVIEGKSAKVRKVE